MAYGPVNVPGAAGQEEVMDAVKAAQEAAAAAQKAADEAKAASENLEKAIREGGITVSTKPVFPVMSEDPEDPEPGEAWVLAGENEEATTNG